MESARTPSHGRGSIRCVRYLLTAQVGDGTGENQPTRIGDIQLIPVRDVAGRPLEAQNQSHAQTQTLHETCGTDDVLGNDPRASASLRADFVKTPNPPAIRGVDLAPHDPI